MKRLLYLCVILSLCLCWGCGDPPNSVMELVLPDNNDTAEPPGENAIPVTEEVTEAIPPSVDAMGLSEMEAILASKGEVLSPIPDDVYEDLWGHWTKAGLTEPRRYYTRFIDADGIAIVGGDTIPNGSFQEARHIVLVMTAKIPELRKALSRKTKTSIRGNDIPFRIVIREGLFERYIGEVDPDPEASLLRVLEAIPEHSGGIPTYGTGQYYAYPLCVVAGGTWPEGTRHAGKPTSGALIHEFAHAINGAFIDQPHLLPDIQFPERLQNTWERQQEHIRKREEEGLPVENNLGPPYPLCWPKAGYGNVDSYEHWAVFVDKYWFDRMNEPDYLAKYPPPEYGTRRRNCGDLVDLASEVLPAFPLHKAKNAIDYSQF